MKMKNFFAIILLSCVALLTSCKDNPSEPVKAPYVAPILIATNTPSKLYPNDLYPLEVGNFWIYENYINDRKNGKDNWRSLGTFDTLFIESASDGLWDYHLNGDNRTGPGLKPIWLENQHLKVFKGNTGFFLYDTGYGRSLDGGGLYYARVDSQFVLRSGSVENNNYYVNSWYSKYQRLDDPLSTEFDSWTTVETPLGTFTGCQVFGIVFPDFESLKPGVGPVAYYYDADPSASGIEGKMVLVAYRVK